MWTLLHTTVFKGGMSLHNIVDVATAQKMRKHRLKEERHTHKHKQKRHHHRKHKKKKLPKASDTSNARRMSTHTVVMTEAQKKTTKERRRLSVNAATLPTLQQDVTSAQAGGGGMVGVGVVSEVG